MNYWDWDYTPNINPDIEEGPYCNHSWVPVLLLIHTVYDCEKCGAKKEEVERESRR